ncbi:MAG: hypothetical protein ACJ789_11185 [Thermomicrobiales bacterium]
MQTQTMPGTGNLKAQTKAQKRKRSAAVDETQSIPAELLLQRDPSVRYERGGAIYATDGKVGTLKQVVVDESSCEVVDLVVAVDGGGKYIVLSPDFVDKSAGSALFLTVNRAQFVERSSSATPYVKSQFAGVELKGLLGRRTDHAFPRPKRTVNNAGKEFIETPTVSPLDRLQRPSATEPAP